MKHSLLVMLIGFVISLVTFSFQINAQNCTQSTLPALPNAQYPAGNTLYTYKTYYQCDKGYSSTGNGTMSAYSICDVYNLCLNNNFNCCCSLFNSTTCNASPGYLCCCVIIGPFCCKYNGFYDMCTPYNPYCSGPPSLAFAMSANAFSRVNTYTLWTCDLGYITDGLSAPYYYCYPDSQSVGYFPSATTYTCIPIAFYCSMSSAPAIANANYPAANTYAWNQTYYTCNIGFASSGGGATVPYYTCSTNNTTAGVWSLGTYACNAISPYCMGSGPTLANATSGAVFTTVYSTTLFICALGLASSGAVNPFYNCLPNTTSEGVWSSVVTYSCSPITVYCSPSTAPIVANANSPTPYTTVYSTTSYTCDLGFQSTGPTAPFMTCNPSGVTSGIWTLTYSCTFVIAYCNSTTAPTIANGISATPITTVYGITYIACNLGYQSSGAVNPYYTCLPLSTTNGVWSNTSIYTCIKIPVYCNPSTPPVLPNSNLPAPYTGVYEITTITCSLGYQSTGFPTNPYLTCNQNSTTAGVWTITFMCQLTPDYCDSAKAPSLLNSNIATPITVVHAITTYTCNYGYESSGGAVGPYYMCLPDTSQTGKWTSVTYSCQTILFYCGADPSENSPKTIAPNQIIPRTIGTTITLQCQKGYTFDENSGDLSVQCVASTLTQGMWTPSSGYCTQTERTTITGVVTNTQYVWTPSWWFYLLLSAALVAVFIAVTTGAVILVFIIAKRGGRIAPNFGLRETSIEESADRPFSGRYKKTLSTSSTQLSSNNFELDKF